MTAGRNSGQTVVVVRTVTTTDAPALMLYTTDWCGYCRRLKRQLDEHGIGYAEIDIEAAPSAAEFVGSVNNGKHVVPTVQFADGSARPIPRCPRSSRRSASSGRHRIRRGHRGPQVVYPGGAGTACSAARLTFSHAAQSRMRSCASPSAAS